MLEELAATARDLSHNRGTFFRLSRSGSPDSYVLGTLHLTDPRTATFPKAVHAALERARALALEIDLSRVRRHRPSARALLAPSGRNGSTRLDRADLADLHRLAAERGIPADKVSRFRAGVLAMLVDLPPCASRARTGEDFAETRLLALARGRGIPVTGLESLGEQIDAVADLPVAIEIDLLRAVVHQARRGSDVVETTIARYASGETGRLVAWMRGREPIPGDPLSQIPPAYLDRLLDQRSARMAKRLMPLLSVGGTFVAVGAAHLPGDAGLLKRIERAGYQITQVDLQDALL